jgi:hypothetical protein
MKIFIYKLVLILGLLFWTGCVTVPPPPYVPFKTYYTQPPGNQKNWRHPIQLECIDNSNIYVYTNGNWWYSGPRDMSYKGWIPTGGGWYPLPKDVWPEFVYNLNSY